MIGWMDRRMNEWIDGWMYEYSWLYSISGWIEKIPVLGESMDE